MLHPTNRLTALLLALLLAFSLLSVPAQGAAVTIEGLSFQDGMGQRADLAGAKKALLKTVQNRSPSVDLTNYGLGTGQLAEVFAQVFYENPSLFYLQNGYAYTTRRSRSDANILVVTRVEPCYFEDLTKEDKVLYEDAVAQALSVLRPGMTEFDRALALHDWLAAHCSYDDSLSLYSPYHALVTGSAVCQGYLMAYGDLLNRAGVRNAPAVSESRNHGWNIVRLDGVWYHVDVTWDRAPELPEGWVLHTNFLRSDAGIRVTGEDHRDWQTRTACTDSRYDESFLPYLRTPVIYPPEGGAYFLLEGRLYRSDDLSSLHGRIVSHAGSGPVLHPDSGLPYAPDDAALAYFDGSVYYTDAYNVYRYDLAAGKTCLHGSYKGGKGFIYGLTVTGELPEVRLTAEVRTRPDGKTTDTFTLSPTLTAASEHLMVCPARQYWDVDRTQWYHQAVDYALEKGLMNGVSGHRFSPGGKTTRAMAVAILYRMAGSPKADPARFSDVKAGAWYAGAVNWAAQAGIVSGMTADTFRPEDPVTREQLAAILYRYARAMGIPEGRKADLSGYKDRDKVDSYARGPLAWAVGNGLITGRDGKLLAPQDRASRAETATILMRLGKLSA